VEFNGMPHGIHRIFPLKNRSLLNVLLFLTFGLFLKPAARKKQQNIGSLSCLYCNHPQSAQYNDIST